MRFNHLLLIIVFLLNVLYVFGNNRPEVGIVEKLGNKIPLDLVFTNSEGKKIKLGEYIDKPTILMFVYYHCPGICSPLLTGVTDVVDQVELQPGKDYKLLTISFDYTETPSVAKKWKNNHINALEKQLSADSWEFLVGDSASVYALTDAIGFYFKPDGKGDFVHAGAVYSIAPDGKICRYLFGTEFRPFDFKMAILEAEKGLPMPTINRLLKFCYSYDPAGRTYVFNFTRVIGTIMLISIVVFFVVLTKKKSKRERTNG